MLDILSYFLFIIMFIVIAAVVVYFLIGYFKDKDKVDKVKAGRDANNTIATVIDKREEIWHGASFSWFITFEFENGNRKELVVNRKAYGLLVKGDKGRVSFNGKQLASFTKVKKI